MPEKGLQKGIYIEKRKKQQKQQLRRITTNENFKKDYEIHFEAL